MSGEQTIHVTLLRPDDLLNLEVTGINLRLDVASAASPALAIDDPQQPAYLVFRFPPQTTFEEAFYDSSSGQEKQNDDDIKRKRPDPGGSRPVVEPGDGLAFRLGGPSRLSFRLPANARIPFSTEGLLDWSGFELVVPPIADVPASGSPPPEALTIRPPTAEETTLQLPFRLHLAPTRATAWQHALGPVTHRGRSELWHTRLIGLDPGGQPRALDEQNTVGLRAVWSPDYKPGEKVPAPTVTGLPGALTAMNVADRHQLVILTSAFEGFAIDAFTKFVPQPVQVSLVMLSALGGWLRSVGTWDPPAKLKPPRLGPLVTIDNAQLGGIVLRATAIAERHRAAPAVAPDEAPAAEAPDGAPMAAAAAGAAVQPLLQLRQDFDPRIFGFPIYDVDEDARLDLSQWAHVAAQGRDHYVRIVYEGRLSDLGHRASLVKVTERRFETSPSGNPVAYLRQYTYIVVKERERVYAPDGKTARGRAMPLRRVTLTTRVTPPIENPYVPPCNITDRSFWVMVEKRDFLFHGVAEDADGQLIDFAKPLIFVPNSETKFADLAATVGTVGGRRRLRASVPGQRMAFADGDGSGNATFVTESISLTSLGATRETFFEPVLLSAKVRIPAVEALTGGGEPTTIRMLQPFIDKGFGDGSNQTDAFAEVVALKDTGETAIAEMVGAGSKAVFSAAQSGGFATPQLDVTVLTRAHGPLGGKATDALANVFNPADVFPKSLAKLFGVFDLAELLPVRQITGEAPKMTVRPVGDAIVTALDWKTDVEDNSVGPVTFRSKPTTLTVAVELVKRLGGAGSNRVDGRLSAFDIEFLDSLIVHFTSFAFRASSEAKTDVDVQLDPTTPVEFVGDLSFVEGLRKLIPPGVFGDGVSIDLISNPLGVKASLEIGLPPAAVGVFALKNVAFSAGLTVPFLDGKPVVEFGFARRDAQFQLAVLLFGGGGFFHIELDTNGLRKLEAAFEFGAVAALDIGVASGEVHIMAGIYFAVEKKKQQDGTEPFCALLTGYLRCGGSLCVLGIVKISVEFYLGFVYYIDLDKAKGRATLTVEVEIACFSKSIELTVERAFGGKGGDPTFADQMTTPQLWAKYSEAFA